MTQKCTVCYHKDKNRINRALVDGVPYNRLARTVRGLSADSLRRHRIKCLPSALVKAKDAKEISNADDLVGGLSELIQHARKFMDCAAREKNYRISLVGVREQTRIFALLAAMQGRVREAPQINVLWSTEWITIRTIIMNALEPYPDARDAVAKALIDASNAI